MSTLQTVIATGTRALQSAVTAVPIGALYCVTDEGYIIERNTGAAWVQFSPQSVDDNLILNGHFIRANRQAEGTLATYSQTAARGYTADRWAITNENASIQFVRGNSGTTPESGLQSCFYGTYSKITSTGKIVLSQSIEQLQCCAHRGKTVRVSLRMKASAAKTMRVCLLQLNSAGTANTIPGYTNGTGPAGTFVSAFGANTVDPTFGTNLAKIAPNTPGLDNATSVSSGLTCAVTTTWQRFGGTFTLPSDYKNLVLVVFTDSQFAAADSFSISEVAIRTGTPIRDWFDPSLGEINSALLPYYFKTFAPGVLPVQSSSLISVANGTVTVAGAAAQTLIYPYPVPMRSSTYVSTFYNPANADAFVRNITRGTNATATAATANAGSRSMELTFTGIAAWTIGDLVGVHFTVDAEL